MTIYLLSQSCPRDEDLKGLEASPAASDRYRAARFFAAVRELGLAVSVPRLQGLYSRFVAGDILYIGKPPLRTPEGLKEWAAVIRYFAKNGSRVVLDYTDHHLGLPTSSSGYQFYSGIWSSTTQFVVPSTAMKDLLTKMGESSESIAVIPDPLEVVTQSPKQGRGDPPVGIWFGHQSNIQHLWRWLDRDSNKGRVKKLVVVTSENYLREMEFTPSKWNLVERLGEVEILPVSWGLGVVSELSKVADYALVISDPADASKAGCSSNRLVTSLSLGLPTIASPMGSYLEFNNFFANADDPVSVRDFFDHFVDQKEKPKAFQSLHANRFTQEAVQGLWSQLLRSQT